jgi:hypothetical protein
MIGYWGFLDDSKSQGINSDSPFFKKLSVNITNLLFIFLVIGIAILFLRKEQRDIFLLAWLISLYLVLHRDLIGKFTFLHRSLSATAHIFIPIIVIGALSISSLIKIPKMYRSLLKYVIAVLIVAFTLMYNMPFAFSTLDNAYNSPLIRLNPAQIEVSEWLKDNIPEDRNVSIIGTPEQLDKKVWWMASYSHRVSHYFEGFFTWSSEDEETKQRIASGHLLSDYVVFDYSDIALLSDRSFVERWLEFEQRNMANHTLLYNKDIENLGFIGIIAAVVLVFFYFILGFSGMMAVLGIMLLFIFPIYLILDNFDLKQDEKIVFSFFLGVGIFPSLVYWPATVISLRLSIVISFVILVVVAYLVRKFYKKKS